MSDKQLEQIDQILKEYARSIFPTKKIEFGHLRRFTAQQILDICQPQWIEVSKQNPYDVYKDELTRRRVIFRFFHGKDYWTLEPPPPEDTA